MKRTRRRVVACLSSAVLGVAFAPQLTSPAHAEMTPEQASAYYLPHDCRNSVALFLFIDEVAPRGTIRFAEVEKRLPRFKREARKLGAAQTRFATRLSEPPDVWPAVVVAQVQNAATAAQGSATSLGSAARAATPNQWWRSFKKANRQIAKVENGKADIRALLGLTPTEC